MKKKIYRVSSLLLSSVIGLMGFNSCKASHDKEASSGVLQPDSVARGKEVVRAMYGVPQPPAIVKPKEEMKVVYGPPSSFRERQVVIDPADTMAVYDVTEQMPQFPGGSAALMEWLQREAKYPEQARKDSIWGRVVVNFIVERDGSVSQPEVARSVHPLLDAEAIRIVGQMPKWAPGRQNGVAVRVKYTVPIFFNPD